MPVYNGARYLREALDSIFSQSFTDFECVLIDDGSTDQTTEIIESYTDSRITYISDGQNVGLTQRLNQGLEVARGEYIARHDDDDISAPQRFAAASRTFGVQSGLCWLWKSGCHHRR